MSHLTRPALRYLRRIPTLAPAVAMAALGLLIDPASQFERGMDAALADRSVAASDLSATASVSQVSSVAVQPVNRLALAQTESYWLKQPADNREVANVAWRLPVSAGDRIMIVGGEHHARILDVMAIEPDNEDTTRIDTSISAAGRYSLLCRDMDSETEALVRVTVGADGQGIRRIGTASRHL